MVKSKILKKGLALLTVFALVACVSVSVYADLGPQYTTTTKYDLGSENVTVTSQVTGASGSEQITYLAYDTSTTDGANPTSNNIVYIDQKAATSGTCEFSYTAPLSKIGTTTIKFGAATTTGIQPVNSGTDDAINVKKVNLYLNDATTATSVYLLNNESTFTIMPPVGQKISSISYNNTPNYVNINNIISGTWGSSFTINGLKDNDNVRVYTTALGGGEVTKNVSDPVQLRAPVFNDSVDGGRANMISAYSTVTVDESRDTSQTTTYEYGVLFSYFANPTFSNVDLVNKDGNAEVITSNVVGKIVDEATDAIKFKALGKGYDGKFAVSLTDGGSGYLARNADYYVTPYLVTNGHYLGENGDTVKYGKSIKLRSKVN